MTIGHVFSMNAQYHNQLLSSHDYPGYPLTLVVDRERQLLSVAQLGGVVTLFKLTYEARGG